MKKSVFITGAASGIGRATACLFARQGWFVGLFDRDETALISVAESIGQQNCCAKKTDVTVYAEVEQAVACFASYTGGTMHLLFNCAGILHMGFFEEMALEKQVQTIKVNTLGVLHCINASLPLLKKTANAQIMTMNSAASIYGIPELAAYSASKFAIKGLTEALNIEFDRCGIHVCDIAVPYVNTPLLDQPHKAASIKKLGVNIRTDQVAKLVWQATRQKKVHWTLRMKPLLILTWLFPYARKSLVKLFTGC